MTSGRCVPGRFDSAKKHVYYYVIVSNLLKFYLLYSYEFPIDITPELVQELNNFGMRMKLMINTNIPSCLVWRSLKDSLKIGSLQIVLRPAPSDLPPRPIFEPRLDFPV